MRPTRRVRRVCTDTAVQLQVAETLASKGLPVIDAMRVFPGRLIADQALPFTLKAPNAIRRIRPPRLCIRDWQRLSHAGRHDPEPAERGDEAADRQRGAARTGMPRPPPRSPGTGPTIGNVILAVISDGSPRSTTRAKAASCSCAAGPGTCAALFLISLGLATPAPSPTGALKPPGLARVDSVRLGACRGRAGS